MSEENIDESILNTPDETMANLPDMPLETVFNVPVEVTVVLGKKTIAINELLKLGKNSVVELESKIGDPVDIFVNERLIARGEIVIVEEKIGITMTEIFKAENAPNE